MDNRRSKNTRWIGEMGSVVYSKGSDGRGGASED